MKKPNRTIAALWGVGVFTTFALSSHAGVGVSITPVGSATAFPSTSLSGANGDLSFTTVTGVGGGSIAGGQSQGGFGYGNGWGEVFLWGGSPNGDVLSAYSMVVNSANSARTYQPFLLDLGTGIYNSYSTPFNPSIAPNLFGSSTVTLSGLSAGPQSFVEFDLLGADAVTLTVGHSYAFGLLNVDPAQVANDIFFMRASGVQTDPNGMPFDTGATGLSSTSAAAPGWGGGPRNIFIGLYTEPVPEPSSLALLGSGLLALLLVRRSKVN